ncbi:ribonuclease Z [Saccharicrinis aurantiacus]|uniref:ribonuclease Z n=1 Tax=Saccharicrinis aurantiacus TaxID=1849719 RepID=UPI00094F64E5|nr:ribonuclease Z [Saccharicrinis aurantiacus]
MSKTFSVTILGSNSALPTSERYPTAQVLNASERFFLIDCGEGTQMQLRRNKINLSKINQIFISHLHGDHCFGLIGLISTLGLLGRTKDLQIFAHEDLERMMTPQLHYFCTDLPFKVIFSSINTKESELIYSDKTIEVETIPLKHRIPTVGFIFREKPAELKLRKEFVFKHEPSIKEMVSIKRGADFTAKSGELLLNNDITLPSIKPRSYAFCTDTRYKPQITEKLKEVDLLYHESTFLSDKAHLAKKTYHSTAEQAAKIAEEANVKQLIIGHFSSRYKNLVPFLKEAKETFSNTYLATEGSVFSVK